MRASLAHLDGRRFDAVVIGAGVNGASAAQHLAAAGYATLLVDKGDFCSGSSSRSSRLLHCGLRYLAPGGSMWDFARHPSRLKTALTMARQAMLSRRQFVRTSPERARALDFHFPIWRGGAYAGWQVELAMRLLAGLAPADVPLGRRRLTPSQAAQTPLVRWLRDFDRLESVAAFTEYQFDWPERICMDAALDAERLGATIRNYTPVTGLARAGERWNVGLSDALAPGERATVSAGVVLNMAGIWIDRVNASAQAGARRKITGTKGVHIVVQLPPDCADNGVATLNREMEGLYCIPWRGMHYFGPTETLFDDDPDDIRPTEDEIRWLIDEANYLLPSLNLKRKDVFYSWAGVRPLTYDPALPKGKRSRELHDLTDEGMPHVFAMTAGPVMTHRSAGAMVVEAVRGAVAPSGAARDVSYAPRRFPENQNSPPLLMDDPAVKLSDLRFAVEREQAINLVDLLFRRVGAGWTRDMASQAAPVAARIMGETLGWDEARVGAEIAAYHAHLARQHAFPGPAA
jgi:glycerol-3-phosphate dehydrogenase